MARLARSFSLELCCLLWPTVGPHLRIYANQNHDDIVNGNDFIAPQLIPATRKKISLIQDELGKARIYRKQGVVELSTTVDTNGNQKQIRVLSEDPPGSNFGHAELVLSSGAGARLSVPSSNTFGFSRRTTDNLSTGKSCHLGA
ncbi:MAG TPA: hypothetical protein VE758_11135 [Chthoniobacterales bacterium]|nr:hypothetical protein [Chthoniobacterales bacterium]